MPIPTYLEMALNIIVENPSAKLINSTFIGSGLVETSNMLKHLPRKK